MTPHRMDPDHKVLLWMLGMLLVFVLALAAILAPPAQAKTDRYIGKQLYTTEATAYSPSDPGGVGVGTMAYGREVYLGAIASNFLPAKTKIKLNRDLWISGKPRRYFVVEDTGANLDFWMPSYAEAMNFGRRNVSFHIVSRHRQR